MPYRFKRSDRSIAKGIERIACEQIDISIAGIDAHGKVPGSDADALVHDLRKRVKKLRGLLRLARPGFPAYAKGNAALRDVGRNLAELRDTVSLLEAYDSLLDHFEDEAGRAPFAPLRRALTLQSRTATDAGTLAEKLGETGAALKALRQRSDAWLLDARGRKAIAQGLSDTCTRAVEAMRTVADDPTPANIHDWRKRVKYHWYQTRLLRRIRPKQLRARNRGLKVLQDLLGDHHNLAVLADEVENRVLPSDDTARAAFLALITRRQGELIRDALALGSQLFAERPDKLTGRWMTWFADWRK